MLLVFIYLFFFVFPERQIDTSKSTGFALGGAICIKGEIIYFITIWETYDHLWLPVSGQKYTFVTY